MKLVEKILSGGSFENRETHTLLESTQTQGSVRLRLATPPQPEHPPGRVCPSPRAGGTASHGQGRPWTDHSRYSPIPLGIFSQNAHRKARGGVEGSKITILF